MWLGRFFLLALLLAPSMARAVLVIEICGSSASPLNSDCATPKDMLSQSEMTGILNGSEDAVQVRDTVTGAITRIPLAPQKPWPTPPNWTAPASGYLNPTPPAHSALGSEYAGGAAGSGFRTNGGGSPYVAGQEASTVADLASAQCYAVLVAWTPSGAWSEVVAFTASYIRCQLYTESGDMLGPYIQYDVIAPSCPDGYVLGSSDCELADASQVVKPPDNVMNVQRDGLLWSMDSDDADTGTISGDMNASASGSTFTVGDPDSGGLLKIIANGDGTLAVLAYTICANGLCFDLIGTSFPSGGTGAVTVTGKNQGTASGSAGLPSVGSGSGSGSGSGGGSCGAPGQPPCLIDETGTGDSSGAGAEGGGVTSQLGNLTAQANSAAASGDGSAFGVPKFEAPTDDSSKVVVPFESSDDCENPTVTWDGAVVPMPICTVTQPLKVILSWALSVIGAFYAWYRFTGRRFSED